MGAEYYFYVGRFLLSSGKEDIPDEFLTCFRETDRVTAKRKQAGEVRIEYAYLSTAKKVSDRLEIMGFTEQLARRDFDKGLRAKREWQCSYIEYLKTSTHDEQTRTTLVDSATLTQQFLDRYAFSAWASALRRLKKQRAWSTWHLRNRKKIGAVTRHILSSESIFGFFCSDVRFFLRAFLLLCTPSEKVRLDYTELVDDDMIDPDFPLSEAARESIAAEARVAERIVVLAEGSTDSAVLRECLALLYPHLGATYSFLDHSAFALPGGTGNLLNFLKGLASSGISNRIVVLFDNDTAGAHAAITARQLNLPGNYRILQLPDLQRARRYPTLVPTGSIRADLNGRACSIEMYLPVSCLRRGGKLIPVQWTGYDTKLRRYQGELLDKRFAQEQFRTRLRKRSLKSRELAPMRQVLELLFGAFN